MLITFFRRTLKLNGAEQRLKYGENVFYKCVFDLNLASIKGGQQYQVGKTNPLYCVGPAVHEDKQGGSAQPGVPPTARHL